MDIITNLMWLGLTMLGLAIENIIVVSIVLFILYKTKYLHTKKEAK